MNLQLSCTCHWYQFKRNVFLNTAPSHTIESNSISAGDSYTISQRITATDVSISWVCVSYIMEYDLQWVKWWTVNWTVHSNQWELFNTTRVASLQPPAWLRKAMKNISQSVGWDLTWNEMQNTQSQRSISSPSTLISVFIRSSYMFQPQGGHIMKSCSCIRK